MALGARYVGIDADFFAALTSTMLLWGWPRPIEKMGAN